MKLKINNFILFIMIIFMSDVCISQYNYTPGKIANSVNLTGEDYITGDDGVPRMSINIWGHVKYPGAYLVYDDIDIMTCLSMAGGPLKGAQLKKIYIVSKEGDRQTMNLEKLINTQSNQKIFLKPYDTIYIDESFGSYVLSRSSVINILLQLINLVIISSNN